MKKLGIAFFVGLALIGCGKESSNQTVVPGTQAAEPSPVPQIPKFNFTSLSEAIAATKPKMEDFNEVEVSLGAIYLALWSSTHLTWADLQTVEQGKYGMVMKDSESQRGKRICIPGQIIEIELDKSTKEKIYAGGIFDDQMRIYRFIAVGSTGELMAGSNANFCGIITGKNNYSNSQGGVAHAVHLVGMFELPENKKQIKNYN